jgi:hypothetical protein
MPRYGRVTFKISYAADLDNPNMLRAAMQRVYEGVNAAVKNDTVPDFIRVETDSTVGPDDVDPCVLENAHDEE